MAGIARIVISFLKGSLQKKIWGSNEGGKGLQVPLTFPLLAIFQSHWNNGYMPSCADLPQVFSTANCSNAYQVGSVLNSMNKQNDHFAIL